MTKHSKATQLFIDWQTNPRWKYIKRPYTAEDVLRLRSKVEIEYTLARNGARKTLEETKFTILCCCTRCIDR